MRTLLVGHASQAAREPLALDRITWRERGVVAGAILVAALMWAVMIWSVGSQLGKPFPGFFYSTNHVVSGFTPRSFTGWQAGLRPWDMVVAVNGQHWREIPRLVAQAGVDGVLVYTVERSGQRLQIAVRAMEFAPDMLLGIVAGPLVSALVFLGIGIFVYLRNPRGALHRYLLAYLLLWAVGGSIVWEVFLSQNKWMANLLMPYAVSAPVAGWIFFWSFPADQARKRFLARWPIIRGIVVLAGASVAAMLTLRALAVTLDRDDLWRLLAWTEGWPYFAVFGLGSIPMKMGPVVAIAVRGSTPLVRQQARVMLAGLTLGLTGWYLVIWAPAAVHIAPLIRSPWGQLIPALYPISIGYAILRYRLLDIRVVVRKGLVYSLLTAALTALFLLFSLSGGFLAQRLTGQPSMVVMVVSALIVAFLFQPARRRIQAFVDRAFFRRELEVRQTVARFTRDLSTLRGRAEVVRLVLETVTQALGARDASLHLRLREGRQARTGGAMEIDLSSGPLAEWLGKYRGAWQPLADDESDAALELRRAGATIAVPLLSGDRLPGVLLMAERRSGEHYGEEELELLDTIAQSAALALENAFLYEERVDMLRRQFTHVAEIQEAERRRIARELHDGVGPALASVKIRLLTVRKQLERDHAPVAAEVGEIAGQAQASIQDIRRLIYDLRPAVLDELGLAPALREHAARFQKDRGIEVVLNISGEFEAARLPGPLETALFRVAQEAMTNVAKHADARQITVQLERRPGAVALHICDDGQGFRPEEPRAGQHVGLWSMQERVEQLGGTFAVESAPEQGTQLSLAIPVEEG